MKCKTGYKQIEGKCVKKGIMSKVFGKTFNYSWIFWIIGILLLIGVFWYGGTEGWFKGIFNQNNTYFISEGDINNFLAGTASGDCTLDLSPNSIYAGDMITGTLTDGKNTRCYLLANSGSGWQLVYEGITDANGIYTETRNIDTVGNFIFRAICDRNHNNQMDTLDCLTNQENLIVHEKTSDCVDSDGNNRDTPGHVTSEGLFYYDKCLDFGQTVTEYTCEGGIVTSHNIECDYGDVCMQTRSGGYCMTRDYDVGDVVGGGSASGSLVGDDGFTAEMDLSNVAVGGDCHLGAKIHTEWNYGNDKCGGIMSPQGLEWIFADSENVKWNAVDTSPQVHNIDLCPLVWDGVKNWKLSAYPMTSYLPECLLNYNYLVEIYVCEC